MPIFVKDGDIVVPGEKIASGNYRYGEGIRKEGNTYYATNIGTFSWRNDVIRLIPLRKTYYPNEGDKIIGAIYDVSLSSWSVDIRSPYDGILPVSQTKIPKYDPINTNLKKYLDVGDIIYAKIIRFNRVSSPQLSIKDRDLGKLSGGRIIEIVPTHVARVIGKKGTMISLIKKYTRTNIQVGQNGRIWVSGRDPLMELKAIQAIKKIENEAHTSGLTDRIKEFLERG